MKNIFSVISKVFDMEPIDMSNRDRPPIDIGEEIKISHVAYDHLTERGKKEYDANGYITIGSPEGSVKKEPG